MMRWLTIVTASLVLAACASTRNEVPDWVTGKSAKYPDTRYLTGRGQADSAADARNRARADLAKTFQVAVSERTSDVTSFSSTSEGGGQSQSDTQIKRNIETHTDQIVRGIQIADMWQDPKSKSFYALAVLPRLQASLALREDIARLDSATRGYVGQARNANDLLAQVAAASHALASQRERDALQKTLQVLDVTGRGVEPQYNSGQLAADLSTLLKRVRIKPQVAPGSPDELERLLSGALSEGGFVPEAGANAPYTLVGSLGLDDLGMLDGWYWMRGTLQVQLVDAASGKVRGNKRWEIKTSSRQAATARRRALDQVDYVLKRELKPAILEFATGN